jgi:peptidoglycan/xylan/chitin deacetylase (PgdA/CDA1 family)
MISSPASLRDVALKTAFRLKGNLAKAASPTPRVTGNVEIAPFLNCALATGTVTADFEVAWAFRGRSLDERNTRAVRERKNVPLILELLDDVNVPITWATVGHLFLSSCEPSACGKAHGNMPRPPRNLRWEGDWYKHDPCTNLEKDPDWYAPDLIDLIRQAKTKHEIGSHSFSHIDFSADTSTEELVISEMEACKQVMRPLGLTLRSLVYPFNNMGHHYFPTLAKLGITSVRHRDRARLSYPVRSESGVYKLYESMNLRSSNSYDYIDKARIFLDEAMKRRASYHLWFHPSDPTEIFQREFYGITKLMSDLQKQGVFWVATMAELAAYCEARDATTLTVDTYQDSVKISSSSRFDSARYGATQLTLHVRESRVPRKCEVIGPDNTHAIPHHQASSGQIGFFVNVPHDFKTVHIAF